MTDDEKQVALQKSLPAPALAILTKLLHDAGYSEFAASFFQGLLSRELLWLARQGHMDFEHLVSGFVEPEHPTACMELTPAGLMKGVIFINHENHDEIVEMLNRDLTSGPPKPTFN